MHKLQEIKESKGREPTNQKTYVNQLECRDLIWILTEMNQL